MWTAIWHVLGPAIAIAAVPLSAWLHAKIIKTPGDAERAAQLAELARGAAALAYKLYPDLKYADLVQQVINILSSIATVPTTNAAALERAAAAALVQMAPRPATVALSKP
jgi:hypothetical protein